MALLLRRAFVKTSQSSFKVLLTIQLGLLYYTIRLNMYLLFFQKGLEMLSDFKALKTGSDKIIY